MKNLTVVSTIVTVSGIGSLGYNKHEKFPAYLVFSVLGDYEEHGTV